MKTPNSRAAAQIWAILVSLCCACSDTGKGADRGATDAGMSGASVRSDGGLPNPNDNPGGLIQPNTTVNAGPPNCGDGVLTADEACDDGNKASGDGCSADCLEIEKGYSCQPSGAPCHKIARCGDGLVASSEACDDGNTNDGDGCTARCKLEIGFKCQGEPSICSATTCGDHKQEGAESCDDGNALPFDGCSATCQTEPNCKTGACTSKCGDGLVLNEECDDGNTRSGDGCSADCKVEAGFTCTTQASCEMLNGHCVVNVSAVFRDFDENTQKDFGVSCGMLVKGVVANRLSPEGTPVLADGSQACIQSANSFAEWYTDNAKNATIVGKLTLFEDGKGGFVNRFGKNGEPFPGPMQYTNTVYGGLAGMGCGMCMPSATGKCLDPCTPWNSTNQTCCSDETQMLYDGNPLFFPIDNAPNALPEMRYRGKIPEQYGYNGWPWEDAVFPDAPLHNFHFTTEVVHWFNYDAHTSAVLDFLGDDDVWVFVNGQLAVDLGAPHVPESGSVTIDASSASRFGLTPNNVYELRVFHAERKVNGSSFKLTLSGFNAHPSNCTPICGDGIVEPGEECDDGVNAGGYEQCGPGCMLGPRCGDGIVQPGEDCDDGNRRDGDGCGSSCRNLVLR